MITNFETQFMQSISESTYLEIAILSFFEQHSQSKSIDSKVYQFLQLHDVVAQYQKYFILFHPLVFDEILNGQVTLEDLNEFGTG